MCSVGFNSQFGMNVTNFQQMQRLRKFGASVRQPAGGMQRFNMDSSLFTTGKTNMFAQSSKTSSLSFNGVQYDNRFAMLNSVQSQNQSASTGKSSGSSFGSTLKMLNNFLGKIFDGKKDGAGKIGQQSLDQINNAQDKQTLSQAIDSANSDSRSLDNQLKADNNTLKAAQNQETQAQQGADKKISCRFKRRNKSWVGQRHSHFGHAQNRQGRSGNKDRTIFGINLKHLLFLQKNTFLIKRFLSFQASAFVLPDKEHFIFINKRIFF